MAAERGEVARAERKLDAADNELSDAKGELRDAKAKLEAAEAELRTAKAETPSDVQRVAKAEVGVAKAELGVAKAELGVAKAEWEAAAEGGKQNQLWKLVETAQESVKTAQEGVKTAQKAYNNALDAAAPPRGGVAAGLGEQLGQLTLDKIVASLELMQQNQAQTSSVLERVQENQAQTSSVLQGIERMIPKVSLVLDLTPSDASTGKQKDQCIQLLNMLRMGSTPSTVEGDTYSSQYVHQVFDFKWENKSEVDGYAQLLTHLQASGFGNIFVVGNGQNLRNGHLFDVQIHELRSKLGAHGEAVVMRANLHGRTDLVCCEPEHPAQGSYILPFMVDFAIEVKTVKSLQCKSQDKSAELEAMLQVIGLNTGNPLKAPPVVLTNLAKKHCVLYLARTKDDPLTFTIMKKCCSSVLCACDFAKTMSASRERRGLAKDFGRGPTPETSVASVDAADLEGSQDLGDDDGDTAEVGEGGAGVG